LGHLSTPAEVVHEVAQMLARYRRRIRRILSQSTASARAVLSVGIAAPTIAFARAGAGPSANADRSTGEDRRAAKIAELAEAMAA
jgi:hypothetical protein